MTRLRRPMLLVAGALAFATATSATSLGHAQSGTATLLFNEGRTLLNQGRYEEACDRFSRSEALDHKVGTLLNLGDCNEHLKRFASAWVANSRAEELARRTGDDERAKAAHDAAVRVLPRLARLVIAIDATYPGLSVKRNETKVEEPEYNVAIPVDPGALTIAVSATGRRPWQTNVKIGEGEMQTIRVPPLEVAPGADGPPAPASGAEPGSPRARIAIGFEIGGGVVLLAGLLFGAFAISTWSSVTSACPNAHCPNEAARAQHAGDVRRASTFGTVSTIGVAVGGAALVTGVVLQLTAPSKSVSIAPSIDRTGGSLVATLRL